MKKTKWHGQAKGKEFEDRMCEQLDEAGIEYIREKVAHSKSTAKTTRGKFDLVIGNLCLELKTTQAKSLAYALYADDPRQNIKIKGHQVAALYKNYYTFGKQAGLLLEYRPNKPVFVQIKDFLEFTSESKGKSLKHADALLIGKEIDSIKEIINV